MKSAGFTRLLLRIVTSRRSGGLLGEWGAAGAAKVPTLRGQEPSFPPRQSGVVHRPRGPKISPEHSLPAIAVGIVRLWVVSSRHRGDVGLSTYRQPIIPLTNTRDFLTLPPVADVGASDDSASELVGTHALRRGLRCCLSLWRTPARCARVPPRVETDMKAALGVIAAALVLTSGCAQKDWIDRTLVTENVTGVWEGSMATSSGQPAMNQEVRLELQQQGSKVKSSLRDFGGRVRVIEGSVVGDMFSFKDVRGDVSGELTVSGDEMSGQGYRMA